MSDLASSLLDQVASGILILDAEGAVCDFNTAARDLLSVPTQHEETQNGEDRRVQQQILDPLYFVPHAPPDSPSPGHNSGENTPIDQPASKRVENGSASAVAGTALPSARQTSERHNAETQTSAAPLQAHEHSLNPQRHNGWKNPERIGTLVQRALQTGDGIARTGYLFAAAPPNEDGSRPEASTARTTAPAHVPFVRITLRPDPATNRVLATLEPLPDPSATQSSQMASLPAYVRILEDIAQGASAASTAASVTTLLEEQTEGLTPIVFRYDAATQSLHPFTTPSMDAPSRNTFREGVSVPDCALCQSAIHGHSRQYHDLTDDAWLQAIHPAWHRMFERADARTCWTVPVMRNASNVLGVIVFLFNTPQVYAATDPALIEAAVQLIHIALERDQQAHDLRERTERLRQMTETMHEVFWLRTVDEVLHVSHSFEDVWGRPVEDLYADPDSYLEDVHPDDRDRVSEACHNLLQRKAPVSTDYRIIRKSDGETRWVRVNFRPVDNPTGPARFAGTVRDATDEIVSQKQLELSEQTYRDLIDHASDAIYVQDVDGQFVDLSAGAVQMYGYSREDLLGKTPAFISAPGKNNLDRVEEFFAAAMDGTPQQFEFWGQHADGTIFPKEVRLQRATYFGEPVVVAFALDISMRVAAEEALRESEQRYRLVVKNMKDMVMLHDAEGGTLWVSPSVKEVTGRPPEEAVQLDAFDVIHPEDQERVAHHLAKLHEGVNLGPIIYRIRHDNGHYIWVETVVQALYNEDDELERIQSASRDVTERKRRQEELRDAKQQAEDADRLKSAMLANMSHEIRTPLTSIIGFSEVLQDEVAPTYQRFAGLIYDSSRRLMRTLDSVLQLSKLEAGLIDVEIAPVNLQQELRATLDLMRPQAQKKTIHLSVRDLDAITVTGTWDGGAMHRILTNLVGNAIKFTGEGGSVELSAEEQSGRVYIGVSDDGVGIDPSFMPHIFEPFKQETSGMRRSYEGTGLGLAIVQRLVEMMGGTIDVESEKGQGTTFTVILPINPDMASVSPPSASEAA